MGFSNNLKILMIKKNNYQCCSNWTRMFICLSTHPHPLCNEKLNKLKLEGLRINNDGLCLTSWRLSWFKTTQLSMLVKFNTDVCLLEFQHRWYKNLQHIDIDINITSNPVVCSLSVLLQTKLFYLCWQKYLYLQSHCLILLSTNHTVHVFFLI